MLKRDCVVGCRMCLQGVHNVLVHMGAVKNMKQWDQRTGPVANMQAKVAQVKNNEEVFNHAGVKVAVVHQYDRFPELQQSLFKKV
jgi:hypothetical protein